MTSKQQEYNGLWISHHFIYLFLDLLSCPNLISICCNTFLDSCSSLSILVCPEPYLLVDGGRGANVPN